MATKQSSIFDADTTEALKSFFLEALRDPDVLGVLKTSLKEALVEGLKDGGLNLKGLKVNGKVNLIENLKTPQGAETAELNGKGLRDETEKALMAGGVNPDQIRYFADLPGYARILNNPYSGNPADAVFLAKKFAAKPGFDERFAQWLKKHPLPVPQKNKPTPIPPPPPEEQDEREGDYDCACADPKPDTNGDSLALYGASCTRCGGFVVRPKVFQIEEN